MLQTAINTGVTFVVSGILGYCVSLIKNYKNKFKEKEDKILKEFEQIKKSQLLDMKVDLSNKFYVYDAMDEVEDYLVIGFRNKCEMYFDLGGNTWIKPMYEKSFQWKIKHTGYLE